eukprot:Hpha_TRINITY_DN14370_c0_g1::TRINITY_DN14370_c0_g1_i1::g.87143::m.87143
MCPVLVLLAAWGACTDRMQVTAGYLHTCVTSNDGSVRCWGHAGIGQTGYNDRLERGGYPSSMGADLPPIPVGRKLRNVTAGGWHTCAMPEDSPGLILCWGTNGHGELGVGDDIQRGDSEGDMERLVPVPIPVGCTLIQLAVYLEHTCVLCAGGFVYCWGFNRDGQLGLGDRLDRGDEGGLNMSWSPTDLGGPVAKLLPGSVASHTCALMQHGGVKCWGEGGVGQLGYQAKKDVGKVPGEMGSNLSLVNTSVSRDGCVGGTFTCVVYNRSSVHCWGEYLLLDAIADFDGPLVALQGEAIGKIACGSDHVCVLSDTGNQLVCWGGAYWGKLGYGDSMNRLTPPNVTVPLTVGGYRWAGGILDVTVGSYFTCVLVARAGVVCWGQGEYGKLGTGSPKNVGGSPGDMEGMEPVDLGVVCDPCGEEEYAVGGECIECPDTWFGSKVQANPLVENSTCVTLGLMHTDWRPPSIETIARSWCGPLQPPPEQLPWQLHPFRFNIGTRRMGTYAAVPAVCLVVILLLTLAARLKPSLPFLGVRYLVVTAHLPGLAFVTVRLFEHGEPEEMVSATVGACICVLSPLALWLDVLRQCRFHARFSKYADGYEGLVRIFIGTSIWQSTDILGLFRRRYGFAFHWYKGEARWFMLCEMMIPPLISALAAWDPRKSGWCSWRNWVMASIAGAYFVFVAVVRPMRIRPGNIFLVISRFFICAGIATLAVGFDVVSSDLYSVADGFLIAASVFQYLRYFVDLRTVIAEVYFVKDHGDAVMPDSVVHVGSGDELVRSLHRLHAAVAELMPHTPEGGERASKESVCEGGHGIAKRLSEGLEATQGGEWTVEALRRHLVTDWGGGAPSAGGGLLGWLEELPQVWVASFREEDHRFYAQDIVCPAGHAPRQKLGHAVHVCCMSYNLQQVLRRILPQVIEGCEPFVASLRCVRPAWPEVTEGVTAVLVYTYESLMPDSNGASRSLQVYAKLNASMRMYGDPAARLGLAPKQVELHEKVLKIFALLVWRLDRFLAHFGASDSGAVVFRGISVRVSEGYTTGTNFVWPAFSSTSSESAVAREFMEGTGTLFIVAHRRAVDISWASVFPSERELVMPTNTVMTVMSKMPESILNLLDTSSDVVVAVEKVEGRHMSPSEAVDLALLAVVEGSFVYEDFRARYVEPQLESSEQNATRLYSRFDKFLASRDRVLLLTGGGGSGKTSTSLALAARLVQQAKEATGQKAEDSFSMERMCSSAVTERACSLPIFVHLPWAAGLLDVEVQGAVTRHIQQQMHLIDHEQVAELRCRPLVVFLDSLDEVQGDVSTLNAEPLLERGGVDLWEWPRAKFVVTCRCEFMRQHRLGLEHVTEGSGAVASMMPFSTDDVRRYVEQIVRYDVHRLATALQAAGEGDVAGCRSAARATPLTEAEAFELQRALQGRGEIRVQKEVLLRHFRFRDLKGGVVLELRLKGDSLKSAGEEVEKIWGVLNNRYITKIDGVVVAARSQVKFMLKSDSEGEATISYRTAEDGAVVVARAMKEGGEGALAVERSVRATNLVLRRFHRVSPDLLGLPFVLYMAVSAAPLLKKRPEWLVTSEPRCQVYEVWIRANIRERLLRVPLVARVLEDPSMREDAVVEAATRLAWRMFQEGEWHSTVQKSISLLDCPVNDEDFRRALLGCMPLRVETVASGDAPLGWRHRTVQEYLIARSVLTNVVVPTRSLVGCPEVCKFFGEKLRSVKKMMPERHKELLHSLHCLTLQPATAGHEAQNAATLLRTSENFSSPAPDIRPPPEALPSLGRVCVGVQLPTQGGSPQLSAETSSDMLSSGDRATRAWVSIVGGGEWGMGDPFYDLAAFVDLEAVPPGCGSIRFTLTVSGHGHSRLEVTDLRRDVALLRATIPSSSAPTPLCELRRDNGGRWRLLTTEDWPVSLAPPDPTSIGHGAGTQRRGTGPGLFLVHAAVAKTVPPPRREPRPLLSPEMQGQGEGSKWGRGVEPSLSEPLLGVGRGTVRL